MRAHDQIQILYEIALSIGGEKNISKVSKKALSAYLRKLGCFLGCIMQLERYGDSYSYITQYSIPRSYKMKEELSFLPEKVTLETINKFESKLPLLTHLSEDSFCYLMKLPGYGILLLLKRKRSLPVDFIHSLKPLNNKLAEVLLNHEMHKKMFVQTAAIEASVNAIIVFDKGFIVQWVNNAWAKLYNLDKNVVIGEVLDLEKYYNNKLFKLPVLYQTINRGKHWSDILIGKKDNDEEFQTEVTISPVFNENNELQNFIGISSDISNRVQIEEALLSSEKRFKEMADLLPQPIWEIDRDGYFTYTNKAGYLEFGYSFDEVEKGIHFCKVLKNRNPKNIQSQLFNLIYIKKIREMEFQCVRKDGSEYSALIYLSPIYIDGRSNGIRGITLNISKLKQAQEAILKAKIKFRDKNKKYRVLNTELNKIVKHLKVAKDKAESAEKAQSMFLSTMSHEIRTPLNAVVGLTNILLIEDPKDSQKETLSILKFSTNNLLNIVNDILDFNKMSSEMIIFEEIDFNIQDLLQGMYYSMNSIAKEKGIIINYEVSDKIPDILVGDSTRLLQVINNLVSNAIKFTKIGSVKILVTLLKKDRTKVNLGFKIIDSGIGIPEDKFDDVFTEFRQASSTITREYGGTGLGLPIVKKLLTGMGSEINVESKLNIGTTFSFNLNLKIGNKRNIKSLYDENSSNEKLKGARILLVEDNKINQIVATRFLDEWQCEYDIANNGKEAVEMAERNTYDVILMDLQMPIMDGFTATKIIRTTNKTIPIIALSASALGQIEKKAIKYGMDDFVTKPFEPKVLMQTISYHIKK